MKGHTRWHRGVSAGRHNHMKIKRFVDYASGCIFLNLFSGSPRLRSNGCCVYAQVAFHTLRYFRSHLDEPSS